MGPPTFPKELLAVIAYQGRVFLLFEGIAIVKLPMLLKKRSPMPTFMEGTFIKLSRQEEFVVVLENQLGRKSSSEGVG